MSTVRLLVLGVVRMRGTDHDDAERLSAGEFQFADE
jgi:hypothetical protein